MKNYANLHLSRKINTFKLLSNQWYTSSLLRQTSRYLAVSGMEENNPIKEIPWKYTLTLPAPSIHTNSLRTSLTRQTQHNTNLVCWSILHNPTCLPIELWNLVPSCNTMFSHSYSTDITMRNRDKVRKM